MKHLLHVITFLIFFYGACCYAGDPSEKILKNPPESLKNGTASHEVTLAWVKQYIAAKDNSRVIKEQLEEEFQVCEGYHVWMFIRNIFDCGNVNCPYLLFTQEHPVVKYGQPTYKFIDEVWWGAYRLFCYSTSQRQKAYLLTRWHSGGGRAVYSLAEITCKTYFKLGQLEVADSGALDSIFMDKDKEFSEEHLLHIFKYKRDQNAG